MKSSPNAAFARRILLATGMALAIASAAVPAMAYDVNSTAAINVDNGGVILRGNDPTSYAPNAAPRAGKAEFTASSDGATYRFETASARDRFAADPAKHKPAFGGFCAVGAALGKKLDGDPQIFRILNGQLYVFVHQEAVAIWDKDPAGTLAKANANWPTIRDKTPASL